MGGGSTIDCSKVIAASVAYPGDAWDIVDVYKRQAIPAAAWFFAENAARPCGNSPGIQASGR